MSLAAVKSTVDEDITAFGESLDSVDSSAINTEENRADWMAALDRVRQGETILGGDEDAGGGRHRHGALDEGRFRVACVQAD